MSETEATATGKAGAEVAETVQAAETLLAAPKVKLKRRSQRACDEKDAKGKLCCGHLKRWYDYPEEMGSLLGKKAEVYRCEFCKTLYKPDLSEMPHSYTLRY
jgi:hypothetical protein